MILRAKQNNGDLVKDNIQKFTKFKSSVTASVSRELLVARSCITIEGGRRFVA